MIKAINIFKIVTKHEDIPIRKIDIPFSEKPIIAKTSMNPQDHFIGPAIPDDQSFIGNLKRAWAEITGTEKQYDRKVVDHYLKKHPENIDEYLEKHPECEWKNGHMIHNDEKDSNLGNNSLNNEAGKTLEPAKNTDATIHEETDPSKLVFDQDGNVVYNPAKDKDLNTNSLNNEANKTLEPAKNTDATIHEETDPSKLVFDQDGNVAYDPAKDTDNKPEIENAMKTNNTDEILLKDSDNTTNNIDNSLPQTEDNEDFTSFDDPESGNDDTNIPDDIDIDID